MKRVKFLIVCVCVCTTSLLSAQNTLIGTWKTHLVNANGSAYDISWTLKADGSAYYLIKANDGQQHSIVSSWSLNNRVLTELNEYGQQSKGYIELINADRLKVTIIENGVLQDRGKVRYYTRLKKYINFKGSLSCKKCGCNSWAGGSNYNSPCPNCGHSYSDHRRAGE